MGIMCPRSAAIWAFAQQRNIKAPHYWLFAGGIYRWPMNSRKKGQWHGKCFYLMTPSWSTGDTPKYRSVHYGAWLYPAPWNAYTGQLRTWRHHMEALSAWLYICEGNPPIPVDSPRKRTVVQIFGVSSFGSLNKLFYKQSSCRWFRHIDANVAWLYRHCRRYSAKSNCASSVKRELWFVRTTNLTLA